MRKMPRGTNDMSNSDISSIDTISNDTSNNDMSNNNFFDNDVSNGAVDRVETAACNGDMNMGGNADASAVFEKDELNPEYIIDVDDRQMVTNASMPQSERPIGNLQFAGTQFEYNPAGRQANFNGPTGFHPQFEPGPRFGYNPVAEPVKTVDKSQWFKTDLIEKIMALLIWPVAYMYASYTITGYGQSWNVPFGIFMVLFIGVVEAFYFKRKRTAESWIFLGLTAIGTVSTVFNIGNVWEQGMQAFFTHLFAVYWVLCRSGRLAEGETSHLLIWDGITGFFVMTFKNFHLNIRAIISLFRSVGKGRAEGKKSHVGGAIAGIAMGIILLLVALSYLKNADDNFRELMNKISDVLRIEISPLFVARCFFTVFFATYLYGLLAGCYRESVEQVRSRGERLLNGIAALRKIPGVVWIVLIGLFSIFYLLFFGLQGSYLFGAFSMTLPTQYTFSEYARRGFGDMCGVVFVNFVVTWLTTRTSVISDNAGVGKAIKAASAILTVESIFFAVIAMLKLIMYINAYGFTPLRLQSVWLVGVLAAACACILVSLLTERKTVKYWFIGSAVSLAVLCLV